MAKKSEGYGFNVGGDWAYPEYNKPNPESARNNERKNGGVPASSAPRTSYGYDPSNVKKHMAASRPDGRGSQPSGRVQRTGGVQHAVAADGAYPVKAVRTPNMGGANRNDANRGAYSGNGTAGAVNRTDRRTSGAVNGRTAGTGSPTAYGRTTGAGARPTQTNTRRPDGHPDDSYNRNARRIVLTEEQRASYERAYIAKHGRPPYAQPTQGGARDDRRQAFLRDEEIRLRREAEMARLEEQKLREEQAKARRAAEEERRRREAAARRAAEERVREAEKQKLEIERRRAYEKNKRKYEAARRAEEERERLERRRILERKLKRRRFLRTVTFHLRVMLITFLATSMVLGLCGYLRFWTDRSDASSRVTYTYGSEKVSDVSKELAYNDGVMCVDFIRLAEMFGFYTVGNSERVKFIIPDDISEQSVTIVPGSLYVEINGSPLLMSVPSRYEGESLWVSSEIMNCFSGGVGFEAKDARNASIQKVVSLDEKGEPLRDGEGNYIYDKVELLYKNQQMLAEPDLSLIYGDESLGIGIGTVVTFNTDLEDFEHYMNPADSTEYLMLANKQNLLASDYIPEALSDAADNGTETVQLCLYAAKSLEAMLIEMKDAGYGDVRVTEGYVSYQTQLEQFNAYIADEMAKGHDENDAMRLVLSYFSAPGTNEHQTGLAVDMHNLNTEDVAFADEEAYLWLKDNAWKFGYILRYPEGAEDITGHSFEPWHYRYVGRYAAEKIYKAGITLEDYLGGNR